jgi:gliding motility-associated-like protein/uncharacterized repeat protein (TIGR01451 family)
MPDNVSVGATKHYNVYPNPISGSTYIWAIDGVEQKGFTNNGIDINWKIAGTFFLEVQEMSIGGCLGPLRSGKVFVIPAQNTDLGVVITVDNPHPIIGNKVIFSIEATNHGPYDATGVTIANPLLDGYTYLSTTSTTGSFSSLNSVWTIGNLKIGSSANLTITAFVNKSGNYSNTSTISGKEEDRNMVNNISSVATVPTDFFIPEGFSPNGDGINDLFVVRGIVNYPHNKIEIFNRWGNKVFDASPYQNKWHGKATFGIRVGGGELPVGTYFYLLDLGDGSKVIKGTIYLNR